MTTEAKAELNPEQRKAVQFTSTFRGQYIISQALAVAIDSLKEVPEPYTEHSNIADMQYLLDNLFTIYPMVSQDDEDQRKLWEDNDDDE